MKKLIFFIVLVSLSSFSWGASYYGKINSIQVKYDTTGSNIFRYCFYMVNSTKEYFLEVKDGRSEAVVSAQYSLLLTAYTLGHTVVFETDYEMANVARARDVRIVK